MDLSRAFDCLPHALALAKLKAYGLQHSALKLMSSYLTDRYQRVKIADKRSDWLKIIKGVPQGSILGPLLFNIFINDMYFMIKGCHLYNYADDNTLSFSHHDPESLHLTLEHKSEESIQWFTQNEMLANPDKFQAIVLCPSRRDSCNISFGIGGEVIKSEDHVRLLGVEIDNKLKFDVHITSLCKKAARQINVLRRISSFFDESSKLLIFRSFILSNFNYCPLVWHFCGATLTKKLENLQERGLRFVFKDHTSDYCTLLKRAGLPTLSIGRLRSLATEVYKALGSYGPDYSQNMFLQFQSNKNFRSSRYLDLPAFNKVTFGKNSLRYLGVKIWNRIPNDIKNAVTLSEFKKLILTWNFDNTCNCSACQ